MASVMNDKTPLGKEEKLEDLIENIYRAWRDGLPALPSEQASELGVTRKEMNGLINRLVDMGYLEDTERNSPFKITALGKARGMELLARHEMLTQFFQMTGGMSQEEAVEDACRAEHVISRKGLDGIAHFLRYGDIYDRTFTGTDLSSVYEEGSYEMAMAFYEADRRSPRFVAPEDVWFENAAVLEVNKGSSSFVITARTGHEGAALWYRRKPEGEWLKARREEKRHFIPTDIFTYTANASTPITEAEAYIAVLELDLRPTRADIRELNIHLW